MCLRFVFLLITRLAAWLRLSRREEAWKTAEILILRHQLAVLQRHQTHRPSLNWADRALLAALLGVIPKARRHGLRLMVTPDTILRWHRDIVRRRWATSSMRGRTGRPATRRDIKALVLRLEHDRRTLDRGMPPRTPGPHPRLEPGPSAADPARVRDSPQPAPASPLPARRRAAETATPAGRSGTAPRPKTHSRRRHDQRISPGRMTWTGLSAPTALGVAFVQVSGGCGIRTHEDASTP